MSKYKAVLFDLDGTLVDSIGDLTYCANFVLEKNQLPTHSLETIKSFVGEGVRLLVKRFLPESHQDDATVDQILEEFRECYSKNYANQTAPYNGIKEMLEGVAKKGYKLAVFSNKPHDLTEGCVKELLGEWQFDFVLGSTEEIPRKPDPAGALHVAKQMGVQPQECAFLGDSSTDMITATRAGMFPIGALWGYRSKKVLEENGAKALIENPQEILSII